MCKWSLLKKTQFAGLNYKRHFFYNGIVSFPSGHPLLDEVKKDFKKTFIKSSSRKSDLVKTETSTVQHYGILRVSRSVLAQSPIHYILDSDNLQRKMRNITTRNYILNSYWL